MTNKQTESYRLISSYDQIDREEWSSFVAAHADGTVFQTPEYYEIHVGAKGFTPYVIAAYNRESHIVGILVAIVNRVYGGILGYFTSRAVIAGGPLAANNDPRIALSLLNGYKSDKGIHVVYTQFRNLFDISHLRTAFDAIGARYEEHLNILIDLTQPEEALWKGVKSRKRTYINQSKKKGVVVRELVSLKDIEPAYAIIADLYRRTGLPLADLSLFENAFHCMHPSGIFRIYGALLDDKLIGTMFVFSYKGRFYDWYAGSLQDYYTYNPNDTLPWTIFCDARSQGAALFDFGGAGKPGVPYGVRDYKIQFGGELVNFGRYELAHNKILFSAMQSAYKVWQQIRKKANSQNHK